MFLMRCLKHLKETEAKTMFALHPHVNEMQCCWHLSFLFFSLLFLHLCIFVSHCKPDSEDLMSSVIVVAFVCRTNWVLDWFTDELSARGFHFTQPWEGCCISHLWWKNNGFQQTLEQTLTATIEKNFSINFYTSCLKKC